MKTTVPVLVPLALLAFHSSSLATGVNNQCCRSAREVPFPRIAERSAEACKGVLWTSAKKGLCLSNQPGSIGKNCNNTANFRTIVEVSEYRLSYEFDCKATATGRTSPVQIETCAGDPCTE